MDNPSQWQDGLRRHLSNAKNPLIVILGPTASGKTDFSLEVAEKIARTTSGHSWDHAEIINADSRQLYRGFDIGTAKIRPEEMRSIKHHLIDVLDPREEVTIAWFQEKVHRLIPTIRARMGVPIMVGGSMLYISAIIDGLEPLAAAHPTLRKKLEEEYDRDAGVSAYARLQELDPDAAMAFHRNNKPYVIRALEIIESTGGPASAQKRSTASPYDLLIFGLHWPREKLVERINGRTKALLQCTDRSMNRLIDISMNGGWVGEVWGLMQRGIGIDAPAMKSHGYREIYKAMSCNLEAASTMTPGVLREIARDPVLYETIAAKTRQYAKRQMTWWKGDPRIQWIDYA